MQICLIGATHPCHNPRLTREADSLMEAGHEVRVVAPSSMNHLWEKDQRHIANRRWRLESVDIRPVGMLGKYRSFVARGKRRLAEQLFQTFGNPSFGEPAYITAFTNLKKIACREPADWFIGHAHPALPVAAAAAKKWNARLGFDCEDLLAEMDSARGEIVRSIERQYLHSCDYVSVPSVEVANRLAQEYEISTPVVLYNVFPSNLSSNMLEPNARLERRVVKVHWFGQTIGHGRGIEEAIEAVGKVRGNLELHLRGTVSDLYRAELETLANRSHVQLHFLPQIDHDELIASMGDYDIGLALERNSIGYSLTVSNKLFSYLLAGLAVAATNTPGQREVMNLIPLAGFLYEPGDADALASGLQRWIDNSVELRKTQQVAWEVARDKFCWDLEKESFLKRIECALPLSTHKEATAA